MAAPWLVAGTGVTPFHMDLTGDNLADAGEREELSAWRGVSDEAMAAVFASAQRLGTVEKDELESAKDLIQWCLERDPANRPQSMLQVCCGHSRTIG